MCPLTFMFPAQLVSLSLLHSDISSFENSVDPSEKPADLDLHFLTGILQVTWIKSGRTVEHYNILQHDKG